MPANGGKRPADENWLWSPSFLALLKRIHGVTTMAISFYFGVPYFRGG